MSLWYDPELPDQDVCFTTSTSEILPNNFSKFGWRHLVGRCLHQAARQVLPRSKEDTPLPGLLVLAGRRKHKVSVRQPPQILTTAQQGGLLLKTSEK